MTFFVSEATNETLYSPLSRKLSDFIKNTFLVAEKVKKEKEFLIEYVILQSF